MNNESPSPQLVILDFDRTIGDVEAAMERLWAVLAKGGYDASAALITKAQQQAEKDGGSFSPLALIKELDDVEKLREEYLQADSETPLIYEDAELFMQVLEAKNIPYLVMSYGADPEWQQMKIQASGYDGPVELLTNQEKGKEIAGMAVDGGYKYETERYSFFAKSVCLIDDKAISFKDLPSDCSGIWLKREDNLLLVQQGEVPTNVAEAEQLDELTVINRCVKAPEIKRRSN